MVELVVGDLYDLAANTQNGVRIHPEAVYECRYCPMFQISGSSLCDSDKGRGHAAAHRIAFEALLQPSPILICPICESPQKTSDTACIFGCMFNDLDLVEHLEKDHSDILADDTVCDFSDSRYLLTTFQEKELPRTILESSGEAADVVDSGVDDGTIIDHSDDDKDAELNSPGVDDRKSLQTDNSATDKFRGNVEAIHVSMVSGDEGGVTHENHADAVRNSKRTSRKKRCKRPRPRGQMRGVSVVTCLPCQWSPSAVSDPMRMRDEISKHVRFHIREESARHPSKSSSFSADQRILTTMDSSLEEYFGKEHLTDLSGIINSQVMESVYGELLAKLFGICVPLVYRILHGNNGNPFRSPEASRRKRNARFTRPKINKGSLKAIPLGRAGRNSERNGPVSAELTEGSDADCSVEECADLLVAGNFESDQHIQCARAECGHSLLALADRMAIVRHIAAHIRHDEARLLNKNGAYAAVACECGMAVGSPIGYIYHIAHDHVFEHKKFSDICATIVSYITLVVDSAIESVLPVCVDFRATKWPLWYAYFSLENDEGDEKFFSDSTDLNEHWLKLWEDLVDEHTTGRSISPGDRIKLFKMHPFVDGERPLSRKRKSLPLMDSEAFYRSLSLVWRRLDSWAYDPVHRTQLASESRWIRLAQIRRKAFLEANKDEYEYSDIFSGLAADPKLDIEGGPHLLDWSSVTQDVTHTDDVAANEIVPVSSENSSLSAVSPVNVLALAIEQCANSPSSDLIVDPSSTSGSSYQEPGGAAELSGTVVRCSNCSNVCINSLDTAAIKNHCALHAVMEGRMLCSLYIHRGADRPQICPFCHSEVNLYKPGGFLHHLQSRHMHKARIIYDRYLFRHFPQQKIFSDPFVPSGRPRGGSLTKSDFLICCQRSNSCGINPVVLLPHNMSITSSDVDIAIVKHILWHVRNDSFLDLEPTERDLLTRALMIRLSSSDTRQVLLMAKKVVKQFDRYRQLDAIKYINEKLDEIGWNLFGVNKGFVYQMVFTRRLVRDQCGMQLYPPCICRICVNKELPRCPSDGRKRAFVAYAYPVLLHILEHLNDGELPEKITSAADTMPWKDGCKIDGLSFGSASLAIKHVLDAHNDLVELSALDMILEDNGLFEIFHEALSAVFGDQAWQLEEALGFGSYEMKRCRKLNSMNGESNGHQPDCVHPSVSFTSCTCSDTVSSQGDKRRIPSVSSLKLKSRIKTACYDMPKASAACYEEFLQESEVHNNAEDSSCGGIAGNGSMSDAVSSNGSFTLPSSSATINSAVPLAVPLLPIKMEEPDERSEFSHQFGGIQSNSSSPQNFLPANDPLISGNNAEQTWKRTSKRRGKRALEIKREVNGAFLPERNIALPLKNVIQGSKTVAAAVVAALEDANISSEFSPRPQSPIVQAQDDSTSNPRDEEESDLSLGNISKRPRLLVSGDDRGDISHDKPSKSLLSTPHIWILSDRSKAISTMTSEMK